MYRQRILKLEEKWLSERLEPATHLGLSMVDYIRLKEEVADEEGWSEEDQIIKPLYLYEGLIVVVSENPDFGEPTLLSC